MINMKKAVLGFLIDGDKVLLGLKKRGYGVNKWNGFGGKVEKEENFEEALRREILEECGVEIVDYEYMGELYFYNGEEIGFYVKVYIVKKWSGDIKESEEMMPSWFRLDELPFEQMWEDDPHWLPHVLNRNKIEGHFWFEELFDEGARLVKKRVIVK